MENRDNFYDCIRALAAALVFLTHHNLLSGGSIGVSIFFCLSGFLITRILLRLPELTLSNTAKFIFRRFMRVWPLMMFQIILTVVLVAYSAPEWLGPYLQDVFPLATFTGGYSHELIAGGGSPALLWTLRAEFWFYVFYPLVLMAVGRKRVLLVALIGIGVAWYCKFAFGHTTSRLGPFQFTLIYLDQLMYGAICAYLIEGGSKRVKAIFSIRAVSMWLPFIGIIVLSTLPYKGYDWTWYAETSAAAFLTAPLILHQWSRPLTGDYEPIATVGRISYSIYLLHPAVIEYFFPHAFPHALEFFARCGAVIGFSLITYRYIELPFIRLSKRLAPMGSAMRKPVSLASDNPIAESAR